MKKKNRGKEEKKGKSYWKGEAELLEDRAYDYGCNSETPLRDAVGSFKKKELIRLWNSIIRLSYLNRDNLVPNCPNSYAPLNAGRPSIQ